jgi:hypothetical protein
MPDSGERAQRQREHEFQRMPAAQRRARVTNPGQASRAGTGDRARQRTEQPTVPHGEHRSGKIAARTRYFPVTGLVGTSDPGKPCPHVKPGHPGTTSDSPAPQHRQNITRARISTLLGPWGSPSLISSTAISNEIAEITSLNGPAGNLVVTQEVRQAAAANL